MADDKEAAKDLYISIVMNAMYESGENERLEDRKKLTKKIQKIKGGEGRGKQKTIEASKIKKWLYPLLTKCEAEFPPERKNRGWRTMKNRAIMSSSRSGQYGLNSTVHFIDAKPSGQKAELYTQ